MSIVSRKRKCQERIGKNVFALFAPFQLWPGLFSFNWQSPFLPTPEMRDTLHVAIARKSNPLVEKKISSLGVASFPCLC